MKASKGFTLVELAVVIAIVAILASVSLPRLLDSTDSAERAVALDFMSQLNSAAAMYAAKQMTSPKDFTDFVKATALVAGDPKTISTALIGKGGCTVAANTVTCAKGSSFTKISATYTWADGAATVVVN